MHAAATLDAGLGMPSSALENRRGGGVSPPILKREGRRASVFVGVHCAGTYYVGRTGGRHISCGAVGPPASGQQVPAIADAPEAGWKRCGSGFTSGSVAGLRACWVCPRSSPFPALKCACALVVVWRPDVPRAQNPPGPRVGAVLRARHRSGGTCWRCGNFKVVKRSWAPD